MAHQGDALHESQRPHRQAGRDVEARRRG
ncbi:MAG: hypothetical protein DMF77_11165, partial [Acidobacteria bacterium]